MLNPEVFRIANTIWKQLFTLTPVEVLISWGITKRAACVYNGKAALRIEQNGRLFQGTVIIAYNACDYYEIYLIHSDGTHECVSEMAYFDNLGDIIDTAVEKGNDPKEYDNFCHQEYTKLVSAG